jgi:hypothetical protein
MIFWTEKVIKEVVNMNWQFHTSGLNIEHFSLAFNKGKWKFLDYIKTHSV